MTERTSLRVPVALRDELHDRAEKGEAYWEVIAKELGEEGLIDD